MKEQDSVLMNAFIDTGIWQIGQLEILNIVRRFKKVYFKSDILDSDGKTVLNCMMENSEGTSSWEFLEGEAKAEGS